MNRPVHLFAAVIAVGSVFAPIARAQTDSAVSEIAALRRELGVLAAKNQQQIDTLQQQVRKLSAELARSRRGRATAAAPGVAEPAEPRVAETPPSVAAGTHPAEPKPGASVPPGPAGRGAAETPPPVAAGTHPAEPIPGAYVPAPEAPRLPPEMANLPGRSVAAPYTAAGPGAPGPIPVTPAAPTTSGGNRVMLSLSGQIDRALLWGNDGIASNLRQVDNNNSSTRIRIVGEARPLEETVAGINLETEIRPNSSATQTLTQNLPQPASAVTYTIRQAEIYGGNPNYGELRLGFGSTASYLTTEVDLSATAVATYVQVSDFDGGFAFRQKGAALVPGGARGALVLSPASSFGPAVGSVFTYFDGLQRDDRIRYDSPISGGFQFATSVVDGGAFDVAGRFAREYEDFRIASGVGVVFANSRGHGQPGAYGYAGVPAGAGGISLGGTNSAPGAPTIADVTASGSKQLDGSVSVLFKSGLNLTVAGGVRDPRYRDPAGRRVSPDLIYAKLGYQQTFFPIGLTAFSIDFAQNDEVIFNGDRARAYGIAAVQNIDRFGLELFVAARYETLNRAFATYHPIIAVMSGGRLRF
jgi:hypothetical protein